MPSVAELRADLVPFVLAVLLLATGLAALALLSRSRREALLISYAAFVSLYAVRLAAGTSWARGVLGVDPRLLAYVQALVTYWITAPAVLFFTRALGPRFERLFRGLLAELGQHRGVEGFEDDVTLLVADVLPGDTQGESLGSLPHPD